MKFETRMMKPLASLAAMIPVAGLCWAAGIVTVDQKGLSFSTQHLNVRKGDVVNFLNDDTTSHNILVSGNGVKLNSGLQRPGVTFSAPFVKPGDYQVTCGIHPKMKMTVTVQ
jgi:cytochrome c peroxidase